MIATPPVPTEFSPEPPRVVVASPEPPRVVVASPEPPMIATPPVLTEFSPEPPVATAPPEPPPEPPRIDHVAVGLDQFRVSPGPSDAALRAALLEYSGIERGLRL